MTEVFISQTKGDGLSSVCERLRAGVYDQPA